MAAIVDRTLALVADDEDARRSLDDIVSDGLELVDSHDPFDLWKQPLKEAEVPTSNSFDRSDRLRIGEVVHIESRAQAFPLSVEYEEQFVAAE